MPFDLRQLAPLLGAANPRGPAFLRGFQRAQQEIEARKQQQQQQTVQAEQLGFQRDANTRAQHADARAGQDQQIQAVASLRQLLEDPTIDDPTVFDQRFTFAQGLAPKLGVDAGFLNTLRPAPTVFQQRAAKKKLEEIAKTYSQAQMAMLEADDQSGAAPLFPVGGERLTIAQLRQRAGTQAVDAGGKPVAMRPAVRPTDTPNTPEEAYIADAIAAAEEEKGRPLTRGERAQVRLRAMGEIDATRRDPPRPTQTGDGYSPKQIATFNQIAGAYDRSPLIRAADRTIVLEDAVKAIDRNPSDPAAQLGLAYSYIQALDTYQSAVREGELQNLGILGTRLQQFALELNRVANEGAFLPPAVAKNIATSAKQLIQTINTGRDRKKQEFASRARVSGVGQMWDEFVGGFAASTQPADGSATATATPKPAGNVTVGAIVRDKNGQRARVKGFTPEGRAILEPVQ